MDSKLFTKFAVPDATADGWGSKSLAEKVGLSTDVAKAQKEGPLLSREGFCACGPCIRLDFSKCEMTAHVGKMQRVAAPLAKGVATRAPQLLALQEWADSLKAGQIVALQVATDQRHLESDYWLAKLLGPAFPAAADMVHAGTEFREGWLICEVCVLVYSPHEYEHVCVFPCV